MLKNENYRSSGSMSALRDWIKNGDFYNPYQKDTPAWQGYNDEKNRIEDQSNKLERQSV